MCVCTVRRVYMCVSASAPVLWQLCSTDTTRAYVEAPCTCTQSGEVRLMFARALAGPKLQPRQPECGRSLRSATPEGAIHPCDTLEESEESEEKYLRKEVMAGKGAHREKFPQTTKPKTANSPPKDSQHAIPVANVLARVSLRVQVQERRLQQTARFAPEVNGRRSRTAP